jgi:hypothetical protein
MRNPIARVAACVAMVASAAVIAGCAQPQLTTIEGSIVLANDLGYTDSDPCSGTGPWSNEREGKELRMQEGTESDAVPIDTAVYSEGKLTPYGCEFTFEFNVRDDFEEYTVLDCDPGEDRKDCDDYGMTWQELKDQDFKLEWCTGCDGADLSGGSSVEGDGAGGFTE